MRLDYMAKIWTWDDANRSFVFYKSLSRGASSFALPGQRKLYDGIVFLQWKLFEVVSSFSVVGFDPDFDALCYFRLDCHSSSAVQPQVPATVAVLQQKPVRFPVVCHPPFGLFSRQNHSSPVINWQIKLAVSPAIVHVEVEISVSGSFAPPQDSVFVSGSQRQSRSSSGRIERFSGGI